MLQDVYYNLWGEEFYRQRKVLDGKLAIPEKYRPFIYIDNNNESFTYELYRRLREVEEMAAISGEIQTPLSNVCNWLQGLHSEFVTRIHGYGNVGAPEIIDSSEEWLEATERIINQVMGEMETTLKPFRNRHNTPGQLKRRKEAYPIIREELDSCLQMASRYLVTDLLNTDFADTESSEDNPPAEMPDTPARKGKPRIGFQDCVVDPAKKQVVTSAIHQLIDGKKASKAYIILAAAVKAGLITKPSYAAVVEEFGNLGAESDFNKKMGTGGFTREELEPIIHQLLEIL